MSEKLNELNASRSQANNRGAGNSSFGPKLNPNSPGSGLKFNFATRNSPKFNPSGPGARSSNSPAGPSRPLPGQTTSSLRGLSRPSKPGNPFLDGGTSIKIEGQHGVRKNLMRLLKDPKKNRSNK